MTKGTKNKNWMKKAASLSVAALIAGGASGNETIKQKLDAEFMKQIKKPILIDQIQVQGDVRNIHQVDFRTNISQKLSLSVKKGEFVRIFLPEVSKPKTKENVQFFSEKGNDVLQNEWVVLLNTGGKFELNFPVKGKKPTDQVSFILDVIVEEEKVIDPLVIEDDNIPFHLKPGYPEGTRYGVVRRRNLC